MHPIRSHGQESHRKNGQALRQEIQERQDIPAFQMGGMHRNNREDQLINHKDVPVVQPVKSKKEHDYWGERAKSYDAATAYVVGKGTLQETKAWLLDQLQKTDNVLELGCGAGQF
jgi:hypothetical protein